MSVTKCLTVKGEGAEVWTGTRAMPPQSGQPRRGLTQEPARRKCWSTVGGNL